ncbi:MULTISPECIES: branched-chain amino acid ABC transporter substrate-binding protein [Candidatus Ichthyocystis]|uniref:branched-chain amino acid ABC transporter substrate-binding protein n=1 Tax=Candidatus Ichthyocystis TaxID=2929841 RepID=UPI000B842E4A|nr:MULTISPECIES: branched-chain amino acid ABC transporter substrate-binding protein [Ichthyocystis]
MIFFNRAASLILCLSCLLLSSCFSESKKGNSQNTEVIIGFSGPLTGDTAHIGVDYQNGIRLAIEDMNKEDLRVNGRRIIFHLLSQNDNSDPRMATIAASYLVDNKVLAVIGHVDSGCTIASSSVYNKANVIQIAPSVSNQKYTQQGFRNTFRMMSPDTIQGLYIAKFISQMAKKPIVSIIDDRSSYGQNLATQVENSLKEKNIKIVRHEYTRREDLDYSAILASINKYKPNILFFSGTDSQAARLIRQERSINPSILFVTGDMACTPRFVSLAGKFAEGTFCSRNSLPIDGLPMVTEFKHRYEKQFSINVQPYALFSYDAARLIGNAIAKTNSLDKNKIISYLHNQESNGITGRIAFKKNGDPAHSATTIFKISGGTFNVQRVYSNDNFSCSHKQTLPKKK